MVSNIPGPTVPLYMRGCPLKATYPVVPLADRHAVSVGMTTFHGQACFGVYADRQALPDVGALAHDIDQAIAELMEGIDDAGRESPTARESNGKALDPVQNGAAALI